MGYIYEERVRERYVRLQNDGDKKWRLNTRIQLLHIVPLRERALVGLSTVYMCTSGSPAPRVVVTKATKLENLHNETPKRQIEHSS